MASGNDLRVHAGRHQAKDPHRLRDVLQPVLAGILQDVVVLDPPRRLRPEHDLAALGQRRNAGRDTGLAFDLTLGAFPPSVTVSR